MIVGERYNLNPTLALFNCLFHRPNDNVQMCAIQAYVESIKDPESCFVLWKVWKTYNIVHPLL